MKTAKVFSNGRSLAVRIPKKWLGTADTVVMHKEGDVIKIRPKRKTIMEISQECSKKPIFIERLPQTQTPPSKL